MKTFDFEVRYNVETQTQQVRTSKFINGNWLTNYMEIASDTMGAASIDLTLDKIRYHFVTHIGSDLSWLFETLMALDRFFGKAKQVNTEYTVYSNPEGMLPVSYTSYELSNESQHFYEKAKENLSTPFFAKGGYLIESPSSKSNSFHSTVSSPKPNSETIKLMGASHELPGVKEWTIAPCECHKDKSDSIYALIVHLNDYCKWSRDQIADWLESLDVDLTFKVPEKEITQ
jgi:hypothetical protein